MTLDQIIAFAIFTIVAAGTPGPSNVLLTATGANVGIVRGFRLFWASLSGWES